MKPAFRAAAALTLSLQAALAFGIARPQTALLLGAFGGLFSAYVFFLNTPTIPLRSLLWLGVAARLLWLGATPALSDDVYRFLWDGHLLLSGQNPYLHLPAATPERPLFALLNSPHYYSVYPPVHQAAGLVAVALSPSLAGQLIILRIILISSDAGVCFLLYRLLMLLQKSPRHVLIYWLNPLVIAELTGNLHFEGLMMTGWLAGLLLFFRKKPIWGGLAWGLAIGVKLLPLAGLPFLFFRGSRFSALQLAATALLVNLMAWGLFYDKNLLPHLLSSLLLYARRFEFNGSLYVLLRESIAYWIGYNPIGWLGPLLRALTGVALVGLMPVSFFPEKEKNLLLKSLLVLWAVYLPATTVHPWYVASLLPFAVLTGRPAALWWSGTCVLSYAAYACTPPCESGWWLWLEYGLVAVGAWYGKSVKA